MTIRRLLPLFLLITALPVLQSCDNNEPEEIIKTETPPIVGESFYSYGTSVSVESEKKHQNNQKHRSSNNFSTSGLKKDGKSPSYMLVSCPEGVTFDLKIDVTGSDETWDECIGNGAIVRYKDTGKFYIADPKNASSKFKIEFKAVFTDESHVLVSSPGKPWDGQKHRASCNFQLPKEVTRYKVECSNENVVFSIYEDVSAASDRKIATNVKHGDIINLSCSRTNYYIYDPDKTDGKMFQVHFEPYTVEWMSMLPGNLMLNQISIPGTHDTATGSVDPGLAKCQNFSLAQQLDFGMRYFDVRFDDNMNIHHGIVDCHKNLGGVLSDCNSFLAAHPDETIILQISPTSDGMPSKFKSYITEHPTEVSRLYFGKDIPTLDDVRGKIVVFRRFKAPDQEQDWGIDLHSCWPDDGTFVGTTDDNISVCIQDRFFDSSEAIHDSKEKNKVFCEAIDKALAHDDMLVISLASIAGRLTHTPYDYAWGGGPILEIDPVMSEAVRDKLKSIVQTHSSPMHAGILLLDFYNREGHDDYCHNVERIINLNFSQGNMPFDIDKLHCN